MNVPSNYADPFWVNLAIGAGRKYGLPDGLYPSVMMNGERSDNGATNGNGTYSPFQITRALRDRVVALGWPDPHASPQNAADTGARLIRESMDRHGGDPNAGVLEYIGGTDPRKYGPVTRAYHARVMAGVPTPSAPQAHADDPFADVDVESLRAAPTPAETHPTAPDAPAADPFADVDVAALKRESAKPATPTAPIDRTGSKAERFGLGLADLPLGAAQKLAHAADFLDPYIAGAQNNVRSIFGAGPLAASAGGLPTAHQIAESVDNQINANARVKPQGGGLDGPRLLGDLVGSAPTLFVPGMNAAKGASFLGALPSVLRGGAVLGAAAPVDNGQNGVLAQTQTNALLGAGTGLLGQGGASLVGRVARPIVNALTTPLQKARDTLEAAGVHLSPGQATQSPLLQNIESALDKLPSTANKQKALRDTTQKQFQRAVLKTLGADAEEATPEVMGAAKARISAEFQRLVHGKILNFDAPLLSDLAHVETVYKGQLPVNQRPIIDHYLDGLLGQGQHITGETYQATRSALQRQIDGARNSDPTLAHALRGIKEALDGAAERSLPAQDIADWRLVRGQYRDMRAVEKAIPADQQGTINASTLATGLRSSDRAATTYGAGNRDLVKLASAGKALLPSKIGDSGTGSRLLYQNLLGGAAGFAYGDGDFSDRLAHAGEGAALLYALPKATQAALNNPLIRGYLINGSPALQKAFGLTPDVLKRLTARAPVTAATGRN